MWWNIMVVLWFCFCSDGTYLREQKREQGAKRTVVVMLWVSTCVNEIKSFQRTQRLQESLLLSELLTEQLHLQDYWIHQVVLLWTDISDYPTCMHAILCLHSLLLTHKWCKSTGTTRVTQLLVQLPVILAASICKSMVPVEIEWQ